MFAKPNQNKQCGYFVRHVSDLDKSLVSGFDDGRFFSAFNHGESKEEGP